MILMFYYPNKIKRNFILFFKPITPKTSSLFQFGLRRLNSKYLSFSYICVFLNVLFIFSILPNIEKLSEIKRGTSVQYRKEEDQGGGQGRVPLKKIPRCASATHFLGTIRVKLAQIKKFSICFPKWACPFTVFLAGLTVSFFKGF